MLMFWIDLPYQIVQLSLLLHLKLSRWLKSCQLFYYASKITKQTEQYPTLLKMKYYTKLGWSEGLNTREMDLSPYFNRRNELSLENSVLLQGNLVVIPSCFQARVMNVLHSIHIDIPHMKNLAGQYVWWPKIDDDIETTVKRCSTCAVLGPDPPPTVLHPWKLA